MKMLRIILLSLASLLMLTSCGQEEFLSDCPTAPLTESTESVTSATILMPEMRLHYLDEDVPCSVALTPSSNYIYRDSIGNSSISWSTRPCDKEGLCIFYSADPEGIARLSGGSWQDASLPALTLTAYPATEDNTVDLTEEHRQAIAVTDGQFRLLRGRYYYEAEIMHEEGAVTYGFICYNTEEYWVKETHLGGCLYDIEYEDPDRTTKRLPSAGIMYNPLDCGIDSYRGHGFMPTYGSFEWDYVNHAGTTVTAHYSDLPFPEQTYRNTVYLKDIRERLRLWFYNGNEPDSYTITRFPIDDLENGTPCETLHGELIYGEVRTGRYDEWIPEVGDYFYKVELLYGDNLITYGFYTLYDTEENAVY